MKVFIYLFCSISIFNAVGIVQDQGYAISSVFKYLISVSFLLSSFFLFLKNKPSWLISNVDKIIYKLFFIYTLYLLIGSVRAELHYIQDFLVGDLFALPYILPLFLLSTTLSISDLKTYLTIIKKLILPGVICLLVVFANLNPEIYSLQGQIVHLFLFGLPLIFLLSNFFDNRKTRILFLIAMLFQLFFLAYYGRRTGFADYLFMIVFLHLIQISSTTVSKFSLFLRYFLLSLIITPAILSNSDSISQLSVIQRGFDEDAWDESRGLVLLDFFEDFVSTKDWVLGRGLNGEVKRTISDSGFGNSVENGYLHVVLKAGNLYFFFILYFFLRAFYLGWFKSNNDFTKAFAALLLIHLFGLIGFNIPEFAHRYILLWVSVPICFSVYYRNLTNRQVKQLIIP